MRVFIFDDNTESDNSRSHVKYTDLLGFGLSEFGFTPFGDPAGVEQIFISELNLEELVTSELTTEDIFELLFSDEKTIPYELVHDGDTFSSVLNVDQSREGMFTEEASKTILLIYAFSDARTVDDSEAVLIHLLFADESAIQVDDTEVEVFLNWKGYGEMGYGVSPYGSPKIADLLP